MNQKTTSFSKILANKNNNLINLNNNTQSNQINQTLNEKQSNSNEQTRTILNSNSNNSFFINTNSNQTNRLSLLNQEISLNNSTNTRTTTPTPSIHNNKKQKNWRSDTNLSKYISETNNLNVNNDNQDEIEEEEEDIDLDDLDNSNLVFSDHAGLYDILLNENQAKVLSNDDLNSEKLTNYDIYKITKKNYKLTFNQNINPNNNHSDNNYHNQHKYLKKNMNNLDFENRNRFLNQQQLQQQDSLMSLSSDQSKPIDLIYEVDHDDQVSEHVDYETNENEEEQDDNNDEDDFYDEYDDDQFYLNNNNSEIMNESIMNWSMKLSTHEQFQKRSQSRSPHVYKHLKSDQFNEYQYSNKDKLSILEQRKNNLSTTSWGKLKHSKSSSSNVGCSNSVTNSNDDSQINNDLINESFTNQTKSINYSQSFQTSINLNQHSGEQMESPLVHKQYQNSRVILSSPYQNESSSSSSDFSQRQHQYQTKKIPPTQQYSKIETNNRTSRRKTENLFENKESLINTQKTTFSQLRQRSLSSCAIASNNHQEECTLLKNAESNKMKKSIGIQHAPDSIETNTQSIQGSTIVCMVVDRNNKLNKNDILLAAAKAKALVSKAGVLKLQKNLDITNSSSNNNNPNSTSTNKRSSSLFSTKHSLPDLTFLTNYSDNKKPTENQSVLKTSINLTLPAQKSEVNNNNDLLKRKTLKSIKRYRQTKQNTEPCAAHLVSNNLKLVDQPSPVLDRPTRLERQNSLPNSEKVENPLQNNKQPLKSCLKRRESGNSNQKSITNQTLIQEKQSQQHYASTSLILNSKHSKNSKLFEQFINLSSTMMFVPFVGYLFSCDQQSSTRYCYYNNLERTRRLKIYKQLTNDNSNRKSCLDEQEDDEDEEDEEIDQNDFDSDDKDIEFRNEKDMNKNYNILTSKSESDLRVKKSVTFLAHVERKQFKIPHSNSFTPSTSNSSNQHTPTSLINKQDYENSFSNQNINQNNNQKSRPQLEAPLLQYDALIAMLKSNTLKSKPKAPSNSMKITNNKVNLSPQFIKKKISSQISSTPQQQQQQSNIIQNTKKYQVIDADSISLASLSESPPSEFKFSDDEETESQSNDSHNQSSFFNTSSNNINKISQSKMQSINNKSITESKNKILNLVEVSKNLHHQQQIKLNQISQIRNMKKNFHNVLLKDSKLNNLKEILLEIKQQQQKLSLQNKFDTPPGSNTTSSASSGTSSTSTNSSLNSPANDLNTSIEMKETIERLSQYLFDFLKQSVKPSLMDSLPTSNLYKSTIDSPVLIKKQINAESNTLVQTFSQYTQLWSLIESSINLVDTPQVQKNEQQRQIFIFPKEVCTTMLQDIEKFANETNHTYLIDTSINTSQLRRKHHLMVMLIGLKFKFQLFIVNLLNYKQLANWFEYLNRDKNFLKNFYDLKLVKSSSNSSGDSGMGTEFMYASTSSSTCSSSLSISTTQNQSYLNSNNLNLNESPFNVTSLNNVSIFENEEYFNYFHKLLQQFSFIDFNLKLNSSINQQQPQPSQQAVKAKIISIPKSPPSPISPNLSNEFKDIKTKPVIHNQRLAGTRANLSPYSPLKVNNLNIPQSKSTPQVTSPQSNNEQNNKNNQNNHTSGFNLKNISKRLNIKSWFTSSSSSTNISGSSSHHNIAQNLNSSNTLNTRLPIGIKNMTGNKQCTNSKKNSSKSNTYKIGNNGVLGSGIGALINHNHYKTTNDKYSSLMKSSLSEPSLNAILKS